MRRTYHMIMTFPIGFGTGTFGWKLVAVSLHTTIAARGLDEIDSKNVFNHATISVADAQIMGHLFKYATNHLFLQR